MISQLTYGTLFEKLKELGYHQQLVELNGTRQLIFQHPKHERATIFLPERSADEPVASMHLLGVRATLKNHGVIQEDPEEIFLQMAGSTKKKRSKRGQ